VFVKYSKMKIRSDTMFLWLTLIIAVCGSPLNSKQSDTQINQPNCFLKGMKTELQCQCAKLRNNTHVFNSTFLQYFNETNDVSKVKLVRMHSCENLTVSLDLKGSEQLTKLTFENITNLHITRMLSSPSTNINILFQNISNELRFTGDVSCSKKLAKKTAIAYANNIESNGDTKEEKVELVLKPSYVRSNVYNDGKLWIFPQLRIQIIDVGNVVLSNFSSGYNFGQTTEEVDVRIQMRDAQRLQLLDSFFNGLPPSGLEVFNVGSVRVEHSEFHNSSVGSMVFNGGVKNLTVKDSLMDKSVVMLLNPSETKVKFQCTTSPSALFFHITAELEMTINQDPECIEAMKKWTSIAEVETTGAVVLALVSALVLLTVLGMLFKMHKSGRLDQYI